MAKKLLKKLFIISILIFFVFIFVIIFGQENLKEDSNLKSISIKAHINSDSSIDITETWNFYLESSSEFYRIVKTYKDSEITDFSVTDGIGQIYEYVSDWNKVSSVEKDYKISTEQITLEKIKLIWGRGYDRKKLEEIYQNLDEMSKLYWLRYHNTRSYTIKYKINNFVKNVDDGQIINWNFFDSSINFKPHKLQVEISSDEPFENNNQIWTNANISNHIEDGKIYIETKKILNGTEKLFFYSSFEPNTFNSNTMLLGTKDSLLKETKKDSFVFWLEKTIAKLGKVLYKTLIVISPVLIIILIKFSSAVSVTTKEFVFGVRHK